MKIELIQISSRSIKLSINNNSGSDDIQVWHKIVTDIILLTSINKAVSLITIDPIKSSIGYDYPNEPVRYNKRSYLLSDIKSFRAIDALNLGDSSEWQLGLSIIFYSDSHTIKHVNISQLFPLDEDGILNIQQPTLCCSNDGYSLYWLNSDQPLNEVISKITQIANLYQVIIETVTC